jgi:hypothetical protein
MKMTDNLYLQNVLQNGAIDHMHPIELETKDAPLWWQLKGLYYTATGYGKRIPTSKMVKWNGKWRRVYCCIYSNIGTYYIGKLSDNLIVS